MSQARVPIAWVRKQFSSLTVDELYAIMKIRQAAFVVEQRCCYQDADGMDPSCWHLLGMDQSGKLVSYLRIIPPGRKYREISLGRFVVDPDFRRLGLGRDLAVEGIKAAEKLFPNVGIRVSGQLYLERFFESLGFQRIGDPYLEDGIPHIEIYRMSQTEVR